MLVRYIFVSALSMWTALAIGQLLGEAGFPIQLNGLLGIFLFLVLTGLTWKELEKTSVGIGLTTAVILGGGTMWLFGGTPLSALTPPLCYFLFGRIIFPRFVGNYTAVLPPDPSISHWDDD